jgi:hypothetical protein
MKRTNDTHIELLDLGHGLVIKDDVIIDTLNDSINSEWQDLEDALSDIVDMAEKIDKYYHHEL